MQNYVNDPQTATAAEVSFTDTDETEISNCEQLEGENIIRHHKMEGGSSEGEQRSRIERGGKMHILTAVNMDRLYWNRWRGMGNCWRISCVRISVTILIEQKTYASVWLYIYV